ncbi:hypothetical protein [Faecalibacterium sp. An122]|uniref:hypothetical protein n=1 Tax=Faecalibacterium sp. An122 TaxID=1965551 RepID=UPI00117B9130|nr:hypothetical protein [Faecalibacterium sp. An122]
MDTSYFEDGKGGGKFLGFVPRIKKLLSSSPQKDIIPNGQRPQKRHLKTKNPRPKRSEDFVFDEPLGRIGAERR